MFYFSTTGRPGAIVMRAIISICLFLLLACPASGQSASEYYRSPVDTVLFSRYLNEARPVTILLPRTFSPEKETKFPLIIVFDRQNKRIFRQIFEDINYLVSFDELPEAVIIGISTENNQRRYLETSFLASDEKAAGEKLTDFLYEELIPWAESRFNCGSSPVFIGHSRFGYFTSYLLTAKITALTGVVSCSPFFLESRVNLVDSLRRRLESTRLEHTVYYRFITGDSVTDTKEYLLMKSFLESSRPDPRFNWKGLAFYDAKHMAVPGLGVMPSLLEIFDYWSEEMSKVLRDSSAFSEAVYSRFRQKMKQHYGSEIGLGLAVLNGIGYKFYNARRYAEARAAWGTLLQEYPAFTGAYISMARSYLKEGDKKTALGLYRKAQKGLDGNTFYSGEEREAILAEIQEAVQGLEK